MKVIGIENGKERFRGANAARVRGLFLFVSS